MGKLKPEPQPAPSHTKAALKTEVPKAHAAQGHSLLDLQRTAGNAAVTTLVSRRDPPTEKPRYTEGQGALSGKDYLLIGTWQDGDTHVGFLRRVSDQWVTWRYGNSVSPAVRAQMIARITADFTPWVKTPTAGQQYAAVYDPAFIAKLSQLAARDPAAQQADQRETDAGLPPPSLTESKTQDVGPQAPASDTDYQGGAKTANAPAMRAWIDGPDIAPSRSISAYTMHLDYSIAGRDLLSQVVEAMNFVQYHWESFDVTALVQSGLTEQIQRQQANKPVSKANRVGRLDPAARRADQATEQLVDETTAAAGELASPIDATHGGTAGDVMIRAQANIDSLALTPASAIVSYGGVALGAIADVLGGDFHEQEVPWPSKPGYYLVRCIAQPKAREKTKRAASVVVKLVQVRPVAQLARAAIELPHALTAEKEVELEAARRAGDNPDRVAALEKQLAELRLTTSGAALDVIDLKIKETEAQLATTPDWQKPNVQKQLTALHDQRDHAADRAEGMAGTIYRPEGAIVSKLDGQTYPLLLQLGKVDGETGETWRLSDVSTADGRQWVGHGATATEAVRNAASLMARGNAYGPGTLAIRFPGNAPFEATEHTFDNVNTGTALARRRLADLAAVLAVLGMFVPGVGQIAAVVGAGVAADRLIDRWQNGSLRLDADSITDVIGVFGAAAQAVSAVGKMRVLRVGERFVLATTAADEAKLLGALKTAISVEELGGKAAELANWGGFAFGQTVTLHAFLDVTKAELGGTMSHAEARRKRAEILLGALRDTVMQFTPAPQAKPKAVDKPATAHPEPTPDKPAPGAPVRQPNRPIATDRLKTLEPALGDLAGRVQLVENPTIGASVIARYRDGRLHLEVGPDAGPSHVRAHTEVARLLGRYEGPIGVIRQLVDKIGSLLRLTPGYGTQGFESRLEVRKLVEIQSSMRQMLRDIDARAEQLGGSESVPTKEREALQRELESIQSQLAEHQALVDSYQPGRGFVAALDADTAKHFANETVHIHLIDTALNKAGRPDLVVVMEQVAQREAAGGNIRGFREWVAETVSRVAGTDPKENAKQAVDKGVELAEVLRLSKQVAGDPSLVVRFTPGSDRRKTFDIRVESASPPAGESPVRREVEVAEHAGIPTGAGSLHKGIAHGASKVPERSGGPGGLPKGREREATVSIEWFYGTREIPLASKDGVRRQHEDGTSQILKGDPPRPIGTPESIPDALLQNLRTGKVGKGVDNLHAVNIVAQDGRLLWRFVNTGTGKAPAWERVP